MRTATYLETFEVRHRPVSITKLCTNFTEYTNRFGSFSADDPTIAAQGAHPGIAR